jgi:hypothetical protein
LLAEKIRQSGDGLLHRANALHDLGTLPHELEEFFVRSLHHLLRRNAIGLSIDRVQAIAAIFSDLHKRLLQQTDNDKDPSTSRLLIRERILRSSVMSWTRMLKKGYRKKRAVRVARTLLSARAAWE